MKTDPRENIIEIVAYIHDLQRHEIDPLEKKVSSLLKEMFPKMRSGEIDDWVLDVIYNDPNHALDRMAELFGNKK